MGRIVRTAPLVMLALACLLLSGAHGASFEELALEHGDAGREFRQAEIGGKLVYFHQRMLGEAIVEKDFIVYQLDIQTGELLARSSPSSTWSHRSPTCSASTPRPQIRAGSSALSPTEERRPSA